MWLSLMQRLRCSCVSRKLLALVVLWLLLAVHQLSLAGDSLLIESRPQPRWIELEATLEPVAAGTVSAQTSGRITALHYDVNDRVEAGATLVEISAIEQAAAVEAAQATLASAKANSSQAQRNRQRLETLFQTSAISQGQLDQARAEAHSRDNAVIAAQAALVQARQRAGYTRVQAPYAGVVTARHVALGESVQPGQALYSGYSLAKMRAVSAIPQRYLRWLDQNVEFRVTLADGRQLFSDDVVRFRFADPASHAFRVRVNLDNDDGRLQPGMLVKLAFIAGSREQVMIPETALVQRNGMDWVYRLVASNAILTPVRLGQRQAGLVEVLAGLKPGERIVKTAAGELYGG